MPNTDTALDLTSHALLLPLLLAGTVFGMFWRAVLRTLFGIALALALVGLVVVLTN
ncbi:hypothetical protein ACL02T_06525 [Pseudonocardia sp. RS010]|uniref:hypothetical protein n=1 Tax=Pseudonocardia sp. RS010 TaxID=3385979 RepID=UPI0039A2FA56